MEAPLPGHSRPASADLEPANDGWIEVRSRRRPRRYRNAPTVSQVPAPKPRIPRWLRGLYFKCLEAGHVKAKCTGEIRYHHCWVTGHLARDCAPCRSQIRAAPPSRAQHLVATAPALFSFAKNSGCLVREALQNQSWIRDISGGVSVQALAQHLTVWDLARETSLRPEVRDQAR